MLIIVFVFIVFFIAQAILLTLPLVLINLYEKEEDRFCFSLVDKIGVSIFAGLCGVVMFVNYDFSGMFLKVSILMLILNLIGLIDFRTGNVYFFIDLVLLIVGVIFYLSLHDLVLSEILSSGIIMLLICIISKTLNGMNWGDVEVFTVLSLILGYGVFSVMFLAMAIGGIFAIVNWIVKKKPLFGRIPLCHCIAIGYVVSIFVQ
ncbi:MAG TPA: A24 family peptidase [Clostridia bacterium]|nr:A24 family peptidase [Clostridia bacterium]